MNRFLRLAVLLTLVSCGGSREAPRELDNACSIAREKSQLFSAMKRAERKWGVPVWVQMATIYQESKFIADARTPFQYRLGVIPMGRQSSAYGYSQALDDTWDEYRRAEGGMSARRDNAADATDFMGWYMVQSNRSLGIPLDDARSHYLAYHEGRTGYARGSYNAKDWLVRIAAEVGSRSSMYRDQLAGCGRI